MVWCSPVMWSRVFGWYTHTWADSASLLLYAAHVNHPSRESCMPQRPAVTLACLSHCTSSSRLGVCPIILPSARSGRLIGLGHGHIIHYALTGMAISPPLLPPTSFPPPTLSPWPLTSGDVHPLSVAARPSGCAWDFRVQAARAGARVHHVPAIGLHNSRTWRGFFHR